MAQVPKFGNWENEKDVPYTAYFEKAKKVRNTKVNHQVSDPSNKEPSFQAREEDEVKKGGLRKLEPEGPKDQDSSRKKHESHVSREDVDSRKSSNSLTHPRRVSRQSVGSDRSFDSSPMHPHRQARVGNKGSVSSESSYGAAASSTPGRSRIRQVTRGDESPDDGHAIPKFGDWDDNDPRSGERYTEVFNKAREDRHTGGGKSPMITTENTNFYGQRNETTKGCGCFPWRRK